ncbi:MAG: LptA/OstA family protein [Magnetococcales bacterium]|nr:LptA/OstA family protein [Magnetococcales bacterium]
MGFLNQGGGGCARNNAVGWLTVAIILSSRLAWGSQGLLVTSDTLEMDQKRQVAVFTGHVEANDGSMHLTSDKMTVHYVMKSPTGTGGGNVREVKVDGNVVLTQGESHGTGQHAVYNVINRTLELIGGDKEASITRGKDHVTGRRILLTLGTDMRIDKMSVQGGDKKRVSARITQSGRVEGSGLAPGLSGGKIGSGAAKPQRKGEVAKPEPVVATEPVQQTSPVQGE